MSKKRLVILIVLICIVIGLVAGYLYLNSKMDKPLGPPLKGSITEQPTYNVSELSTLDQISTPVEESPQNQTNQKRPLCGDKPVLTVLLVGIDTFDKNYLYGLADST